MSRVWKVGDVVKGKNAYASLPVGATVWPDDETHTGNAWLTKVDGPAWQDTGTWIVLGGPGDPRIIRSLPEHA